MKISLLRHHALMVADVAFSYKIDYVRFLFYILKGIQSALLVQKLLQFCWMGGFCLLVEHHWEGSAPSACAAGLFTIAQDILYKQIEATL